MNLLQDGMQLADIGNMLRHESARTTTVYARHDIEALRPLARPLARAAARRGGRIMTSLSTLLSEYLDHRRRFGADMASAGESLEPFVAFADAEGAERITTDLFLRWKAAFGSGRPEHVGHPARRRAQICSLAARH